MPDPGAIDEGQAPPNVPSEIENLYLASQCPPGETRPHHRPPAANGLVRDLPTPPRDTPTIAPHMQRTRSQANNDANTSQEHAGLPHGVYLREPHQLETGSDLLAGSMERSGAAPDLNEPPLDSPTHAPVAVSDDAADSSPSWDDLLNAAARAEVDSETGTHGSASSLFGGHPPQSPSTSSASDTREHIESVYDRVRWPLTRLQATRAQMRTTESIPASGPTSASEQTLQRAYHTVQDPSTLHHLRNSASGYARAASRGEWMSLNQRNTMSFVSQSVETARRQGHETIEPTTAQSPSRHVRNNSGVIAPSDRSEMIVDLPPLTPLVTNEAKDYGLGDPVSPAAFDLRESPFTPLSLGTRSSETSPSGVRYHTLKNHRLGRYQPHCLYNGAMFMGHQRSDRQEYNVRVEIKHVDMDESFLCGHLIIEGLTRDHPKLETYFEGEIIGCKYTFTTHHSDWGASEKQDLLHWNRFPAWKPLARQARQPDFSYGNFSEREHIFMRWKEYHLVPDHRVTAISGASFEGFYYICFNQRKGTFDGIYYHAKSERSRWQQLSLQHVPADDRGCTPAVELC